MTLQETIEQIHPLSKEAMDRAKAHWDGIATVSYTHLTLPTIA